MGIGLTEQEHQHGGKDYQAAFEIVTYIHDPGLVESVAEHSSHRSENKHGNTAESKVQALQKSIVVADFKYVEAYSKAVEHGTELRNQSSEKHQTEVASGKDVSIFIFHFH